MGLIKETNFLSVVIENALLLYLLKPIFVSKMKFANFFKTYIDEANKNKNINWEHFGCIGFHR